MSPSGRGGLRVDVFAFLSTYLNLLAACNLNESSAAAVALRITRYPDAHSYVLAAEKQDVHRVLRRQDFALEVQKCHSIHQNLICCFRSTQRKLPTRSNPLRILDDASQLLLVATRESKCDKARVDDG